MAGDEFVDVAMVDKSLIIDLRYATKNNFTREVMYSLPKCFIRKKVAAKLVIVQKNLKKRGLGLKIYDAYRPLSVQRKFWEILPDPRFIADPAVGSKHNRGAAVDLTLIDRLGKELPMPTPYDDFTKKAHRNFIDLPQEVLENRQLLEQVMQDQGFLPLPTEWWHFDDEEWESYPVEDLSLEEIDRACRE